MFMAELDWSIMHGKVSVLIGVFGLSPGDVFKGQDKHLTARKWTKDMIGIWWIKIDQLGEILMKANFTLLPQNMLYFSSKISEEWYLLKLGDLQKQAEDELLVIVPMAELL